MRSDNGTHFTHYTTTPWGLTALVCETEEDTVGYLEAEKNALGQIRIPAGTQCKRVRGKNDTDVYEVSIPNWPLTLTAVDPSRGRMYARTVLLDTLTDEQREWVTLQMRPYAMPEEDMVGDLD